MPQAARALVLWRAWALRRMTHRGVLATAVTSRGRLLQSTLLRGWRAFVQRQLAVTALRRMARVHHATRLCRRLLERWAAFTAFGLKVCLWFSHSLTEWRMTASSHPSSPSTSTPPGSNASTPSMHVHPLSLRSECHQ